MIPLSILDLSPISAGGDAVTALRNTVDLAQHGDATAIGVDGLLRATSGDHPGNVRLGIEGEPHGHHVRRTIGPQRGQHG